MVFVLSVGLWWAYDPAGGGGYQFESSWAWIDTWGVSYALGLDGISLFMVMLTAFTTPLAILGSFNYIETRQKPFYALMLLLEVGVGRCDGGTGQQARREDGQWGESHRDLAR